MFIKDEKELVELLLPVMRLGLDPFQETMNQPLNPRLSELCCRLSTLTADQIREFLTAHQLCTKFNELTEKDLTNRFKYIYLKALREKLEASKNKSKNEGGEIGVSSSSSLSTSTQGVPKTNPLPARSVIEQPSSDYPLKTFEEIQLGAQLIDQLYEVATPPDLSPEGSPMLKSSLRFLKKPLAERTFRTNSEDSATRLGDSPFQILGETPIGGSPELASSWVTLQAERKSSKEFLTQRRSSQDSVHSDTFVFDSPHNSQPGSSTASPRGASSINVLLNVNVVLTQTENGLQISSSSSSQGLGNVPRVLAQASVGQDQVPKGQSSRASSASFEFTVPSREGTPEGTPIVVGSTPLSESPSIMPLASSLERKVSHEALSFSKVGQGASGLEKVGTMLRRGSFAYSDTSRENSPPISQADSRSGSPFFVSGPSNELESGVSHTVDPKLGKEKLQLGSSLLQAPSMGLEGLKEFQTVESERKTLEESASLSKFSKPRTDSENSDGYVQVPNQESPTGSEFSFEGVSQPGSRRVSIFDGSDFNASGRNSPNPNSRRSSQQFGLLQDPSSNVLNAQSSDLKHVREAGFILQEAAEQVAHSRFTSLNFTSLENVRLRLQAIENASNDIASIKMEIEAVEIYRSLLLQARSVTQASISFAENLFREQFPEQYNNIQSRRDMLLAAQSNLDSSTLESDQRQVYAELLAAELTRINEAIVQEAADPQNLVNRLQALLVAANPPEQPVVLEVAPNLCLYRSMREEADAIITRNASIPKSERPESDIHRLATLYGC